MVPHPCFSLPVSWHKRRIISFQDSPASLVRHLSLFDLFLQPKHSCCCSTSLFALTGTAPAQCLWQLCLSQWWQAALEHHWAIEPKTSPSSVLGLKGTAGLGDGTPRGHHAEQTRHGVMAAASAVLLHLGSQCQESARPAPKPCP